MKYHLVKFRAECSNEFPVSGTRLCEDWIDFIANVKATITFPYVYSINDDAHMLFTDWNDFISCFEVIAITGETYDKLEALDLGNFGEFPVTKYVG